eukprot:834261-Pyramimonas_sp.AAC.2
MTTTTLTTTIPITPAITVGPHAKKHPACLQGALGFLGFEGFALENVMFPYQRSMDVRASPGLGFL